jgi:hypothetical protein
MEKSSQLGDMAKEEDGFEFNTDETTVFKFGKGCD